MLKINTQGPVPCRSLESPRLENGTIANHLPGDPSNTREEPANHSGELAAFSPEDYDTDKLNLQKSDCLPPRNLLT
jgi:hypothetical protein